MEEQKKNPAQGLSESEQVQVRRQKLADLQAAGSDPFALTKFPQDAYSADLKEEFAALPNETDSGKTVARCRSGRGTSRAGGADSWPAGSARWHGRSARRSWCGTPRP